MKKDKEIIYIVILLIVTLAVVFIFIIPNMKKISLIAKEVTASENRLEELQKSGQNKTEALKNYSLIKENLPTLNTLIPKQGEELSFITDLEEMASQNNLIQEINITINEEAQTEAVSPVKENISLPFQLILDGNFYNVLNFLRDLEMSKYYLNIEAVHMSQKVSGYKTYFEGEMLPDTPNDVHVILTGISYWH